MSPELKPGLEITNTTKEPKLGFVGIVNDLSINTVGGVVDGMSCEKDGCDKSCFDPCDRGPIGDPCDRDPCYDPCDRSPCYEPR